MAQYSRLVQIKKEIKMWIKKKQKKDKKWRRKEAKHFIVNSCTGLIK